MKRYRIAAIAAVISLVAGAAHAYRATLPIRMPAPGHAAASACLALIQAVPVQGRSADLPHGGLQPTARTLWRSQDNTRAIEFALLETATSYVATFRPFDVPAPYAGHYWIPTTPAYGLLEIGQGGIVTQYPMTNLNGTLVAEVPKHSVSFFGNTLLTAGAWEAGTNWSLREEAFFWTRVPFRVQ
jgi:hypothetical protein